MSVARHRYAFGSPAALDPNVGTSLSSPSQVLFPMEDDHDSAAIEKHDISSSSNATVGRRATRLDDRNSSSSLFWDLSTQQQQNMQQPSIHNNQTPRQPSALFPTAHLVGGVTAAGGATTATTATSTAASTVSLPNIMSRSRLVYARVAELRTQVQDLLQSLNPHHSPRSAIRYGSSSSLSTSTTTVPSDVLATFTDEPNAMSSYGGGNHHTTDITTVLDALLKQDVGSGAGPSPLVFMNALESVQGLLSSLGNVSRMISNAIEEPLLEWKTRSTAGSGSGGAIPTVTGTGGGASIGSFSGYPSLLSHGHGVADHNATLDHTTATTSSTPTLSSTLCSAAAAKAALQSREAVAVRFGLQEVAILRNHLRMVKKDVDAIEHAILTKLDVSPSTVSHAGTAAATTTTTTISSTAAAASTVDEVVCRRRADVDSAAVIRHVEQAMLRDPRFALLQKQLAIAAAAEDARKHQQSRGVLLDSNTTSTSTDYEHRRKSAFQRELEAIEAAIGEELVAQNRLSTTTSTASHEPPLLPSAASDQMEGVEKAASSRNGPNHSVGTEKQPDFAEFDCPSLEPEGEAPYANFDSSADKEGRLAAGLSQQKILPTSRYPFPSAAAEPFSPITLPADVAVSPIDSQRAPASAAGGASVLESSPVADHYCGELERVLSQHALDDGGADDAPPARSEGRLSMGAERNAADGSSGEVTQGAAMAASSSLLVRSPRPSPSPSESHRSPHGDIKHAAPLGASSSSNPLCDTRPSESTTRLEPPSVHFAERLRQWVRAFLVSGACQWIACEGSNEGGETRRTFYFNLETGERQDSLDEYFAMTVAEDIAAQLLAEGETDPDGWMCVRPGDTEYQNELPYYCHQGTGYVTWNLVEWVLQH